MSMVQREICGRNHASCVQQVVKVYVVKKVSHIPSLVTTVPKEI